MVVSVFPPISLLGLALGKRAEEHLRHRSRGSSFARDDGEKPPEWWVSGTTWRWRRRQLRSHLRYFFPTKPDQDFAGTPSELSIFHTSVSVAPSFKCDEIPLNNNWCLYELWTYYLQGFPFQGLGVYCTKFRTFFFFFSHYSHLFWAQGDPPQGDFQINIPWRDPSSLTEFSKLNVFYANWAVFRWDNLNAA